MPHVLPQIGTVEKVSLFFPFLNNLNALDAYRATRMSRGKHQVRLVLNFKTKGT